jgi:hypothetical protein
MGMDGWYTDGDRYCSLTFASDVCWLDGTKKTSQENLLEAKTTAARLRHSMTKKNELVSMTSFELTVAYQICR